MVTIFVQKLLPGICSVCLFWYLSDQSFLSRKPHFTLWNQHFLTFSPPTLMYPCCTLLDPGWYTALDSITNNIDRKPNSFSVTLNAQIDEMLGYLKLQSSPYFTITVKEQLFSFLYYVICFAKIMICTIQDPAKYQKDVTFWNMTIFSENISWPFLRNIQMWELADLHQPQNLSGILYMKQWPFSFFSRYMVKAYPCCAKCMPECTCSVCIYFVWISGQGLHSHSWSRKPHHFCKWNAFSHFEVMTCN